MDHFHIRDHELCCEKVRLSDVADQFGTPTYVYSRATITRHVNVLKEALGSLDHLICYAVKANSNLAILELLQSLGCGFDAVSVGELARVLHVGADVQRTIVSGVGKRDDEITAALEAGVLYITVESAQELDAIAAIAKRLGVQAPISIRVNPDVDAKTHAYISTGMKQNKFGVPVEEALKLYRAGLNNPALHLVGLTCHIGSQITDLEPFVDAAQRMQTLTQTLIAEGVPLRYLGMGGGLGIPYMGESPPSPKLYGEALAKALGNLNLTLVVEPGRVIVGNAGILLTRVVRTKQGAERAFAVVDAGMNDLIRPALYQANHQLAAVRPEDTTDTEIIDVVGPVCESSDTFAKQQSLPRWQPGDLIAIRSTGAYGFVMASNYNGRPRPAEVLCDDDTVNLIRRRETIEELWQGEYHLNTNGTTSDTPQEKST